MNAGLTSYIITLVCPTCGAMVTSPFCGRDQPNPQTTLVSGIWKYDYCRLNNRIAGWTLEELETRAFSAGITSLEKSVLLHLLQWGKVRKKCVWKVEENTK